MALTDEGTNTTMLVQPSGFGGNNGFGDFGNGGAFWILLLFILLGNGAWGNGFGGYGGNIGSEMYPWMNQSNQINGGFRDQMINGTINEIQSAVTNGFGNVQTALCNGFAGVNATVNSGFAGAEASANARQIANMQQAYGAQTAMMQGFNGLQSQFADCCCENRLGVADLKYTVATENCADRTQAMQNTRDIIDSQTRSTQAILDKLCQLELDGVKGQLAQAQRENVGLQNQLNMANLNASQVEQTAQIRASQATTANQLVSELRSCPIPCQPVYGNQPIFTCGGNTGCGCGSF
mgnify:CR=1 FL=1